MGNLKKLKRAYEEYKIKRTVKCIAEILNVPESSINKDALIEARKARCKEQRKISISERIELKKAANDLKIAMGFPKSFFRKRWFRGKSKM